MTYNVRTDLMELYHEVKKEHPEIDHEMVMMFAEDMPDEFEMVLMRYKYGCHIATKSMYEEAVSYLENQDGTEGAHWDAETIKAKAGIDFSNKKYTLWDYAYIVNMHYSDYGDKIGTDTIFWMAKRDLEDKDYMGEPSERAYKDAKKRIKYFSKD